MNVRHGSPVNIFIIRNLYAGKLLIIVCIFFISCADCVSYKLNNNKLLIPGIMIYRVSIIIKFIKRDHFFFLLKLSTEISKRRRLISRRPILTVLAYKSVIVLLHSFFLDCYVLLGNIFDFPRL